MMETIFAGRVVSQVRGIEGSSFVRQTNPAWTEPVCALNPATIAVYPLF